MSQNYYYSIECESTSREEKKRDGSQLALCLWSRKLQKNLAHFQTIKSMKWNVPNEPIDLKDCKLYFNRIYNAQWPKPRASLISTDI